jgi:hypothetical protein
VTLSARPFRTIPAFAAVMGWRPFGRRPSIIRAVGAAPKATRSAYDSSSRRDAFVTALIPLLVRA